MATKFEKATALFDLADQVAVVSTKVLVYRLANQQTLELRKVKKLRALEDELDAKSTDLRAAAVEAVTDDVAGELAEVTAATVRAQKVISKIAEIEKTIQVVTAVIALGAAVLAGDAGAIVTAGSALKNVAGEARAANANKSANTSANARAAATA